MGFLNLNEVCIGKKVWYHSIIGDSKREEAIITSEPFEMCGITCCFIDIRSSCVNIESLEERFVKD